MRHARAALAALVLCVPAGAVEPPHADPDPEALAVAVAPAGALLAGSYPLHLTITVSGLPTGGEALVRTSVDGRLLDERTLGAGEHDLTLPEADLAGGRRTLALEASAGGATAAVEAAVTAIPAWLAAAPPLIAIALALVFKDVLISLFLGTFAGALILALGDPLAAFARALDTYVLPSVADADHASILIFSTLLGGMVGVMSRSGGTHGVVERLTPLATSARRGQLATWLMGILIFFDDYANTLIVGPTMRPITDRLRISREKLAYIVDSTSAPVASLVPISTWIGFEVGLIAAAFQSLDLPYNAYTAFIASIPFRFYPIFALVLGFTVAFSCRDLGPMLAAERRSAATGKVIADGAVPLADFAERALAPPQGKPRRAGNALLPIATVIAVTLGGLYASGSAGLSRADYPSTFAWLRECFANSNSFRALLWASLAGLAVAVLLPVAQRILTMGEATQAMVEGFKSMLLAVVVLILAWSIGEVCDALHTADFAVGTTSGAISPHWLPVLTFLIAAVIAFATGTSWATMAILIPLVVPISHGLSLAAGHPVGTDAYFLFLVGTISSVLAGSVWGDHCSPISDTTILSSMATGCDHIAHVRTQMPYALGIGVLGMAVGDIPTAFGVSPWISIAVGTALIVGGVLLFGKRTARE